MEKTIIFNKSKFLAEISSRMTGLESKTKAMLKSLMQEEAASNVDDNLDKLLKEFKSKVSVSPTIKLPDEVYMAAMQSVVAVEAPSISSPYYEGEIVKMLGAYVADLLDKNNRKITVDGTTYEISTPAGPTLGLVTVTVNNKTHILNWTDSSNLQKTLESFKTEVAAFGKANTIDAVCVALLKDAAYGLIDSWVDALAKAKGGVARDIFETLQGYIKAERDTSDVVGKFIYDRYNQNLPDDIFFKALRELTAKIFKKSNKQITSAIDKYTALMEKWDALDSYLSANEISPTTLANSSEYKNFVKAFNALGAEISYNSNNLDNLIESFTGYKITDVNDEVINESRASVYGTSQDDAIIINGSNVRVYSGEGDDNILSNGKRATIIGEQGNDKVLLGQDGDTYDQVDTGEGDDTISAYSGHNTINGGTGNDSIFVSYTSKKVEKNEIYGGAGNDTITVASATGNTVVGEDGNDLIYISEEASSNTISGGKGNDTINLTGSSYNVVNYQDGDGNDTIFGFDENDTLYILGGDTSTSTVGADVIVKVGSGSVTFKDDAGKSLKIIKIPTGEEIVARLKELQNNKSIWGTSKSDIIRKSLIGAIIDGNSGNDTIQNYGGSSVTIDGGDGNDSIMNYSGDNGNIDGGDGNDSIYNGSYYDNGGSSVTINGGVGNDYIHSYEDSVKIDGSDGVDIIYNGNYYKNGLSNVTVNGGSNVIINGGADNDYIYNYRGNNMKIDGDAGNDYIRSYGDSIKIDGGVGNDSIYNSGNNATIAGGTGNDTILSWGDSVKIDSGADDDIIDHYSGNSVAIDGGAGADHIFSEGSYSTITGGTGNDSLSNSGNNVTITGDIGDDYIYNYGDSVTIDGGDGDESIHNRYGNSVTINGGTGNDTVYLNSTTKIGNVYIYDLGDGDDKIYYSTKYDTISIGGGTYSTQTSGSDLIIKVGADARQLSSAGAMTLFGAANTAVNIVGTLGTGSDEEPATIGVTINNTVSGVTLNGTANKDSITNYGGDELLIIAAADADTILSYGDSVTINAGAGNDIIDDAGINSLIDGGAGNDKINLFGGGSSSVLTVRGGLGDDTIYGDISAHIYQYAQGDGNDTIFGYNEDDTLYISSGIISSASVSGEDVVLKIGSGSVNLKAAKAQSIKIKISSGTVIETIIGGSGEDTLPQDTDTLPAGISISGATLTASTAFTGNSIDLADYATTVTKVNASSLSRGISIVGTAAANSLKGGKGADTIFGDAGNDTVSLGGGSDIYVYQNGNDLIQDYTSGADKIKLASASITGSSLSGSNVVLKTSTGNITVKNSNDKQITIVNADGSTISTVISGGSSSTGVTIDNSNNNTVIAGTSYADSIHNSGDSVKIETGAGNDTIESWYSSPVTIDAGAGADFIDILSSFNGKITAGEGNDFIDNRYNSSMTINGGKGEDTIYNYYLTGDGQNIFQYTSGDGNDTIIGYNPYDTISITGAAYSTSTVGNDVIISVGSGKITLKDAKAFDLNINGTLKDGNDTTPAGISISGATLTASTVFTGNSIDLVDYATTVTKVNAAALSRGISIVGTAAANSLKGGKGADTISGGAGNDTVSLGSGSDVYVYQSGNDLIQDYTYGADKIKLASASITGSSLSGSNVVLKTSAGNLTVKGAKNQAITIIDLRGTETTKIYPETSSDTLPTGFSYDSAKKTLTVSASYSGADIDLANFATTTKTVDASKFTKAIKITGSTRAESLIGGSKADTLIGGKGNDTLKGNGGADIFVYSNGDGADVIADFTTGDKISLSGASVTSASLKSSDMVLKIGSGSLTVKNGKGKEISVGSSIYYNNLVYDAKKTAVTLASGFTGSLKAADYASTVKKIDASTISKSVNLVGNSQANTIVGGSKAETIYGGTGNDSISGGAGNDKLYGDVGNDKLLGGAGADTLFGGVGADTLTGGDGKDVFVYANGDSAEVIADFTAGQDSIKLTSGTVASASLKGSDIVLKIGSGSLTIKNGKGKEISVGSAIYYNNFVYDAKKTTVTLASGFTGSLKAADYSSSVKKIDASAVSKSVNLVGNSQANTILGGGKAETIYGGTGNDSINGGAGKDKLYGEAGNDTLWGGAGNDTFVYGTGEGKDVIADYTASDTIKISSGTITATGYKSNDVIFTVGSGTLTVKNGKGKAITITDAGNKTSTKTYTNGVTYGSNGTRRSNALWFTEDDTNFIGNSSKLDEISTADYSVTDVEIAASSSDLVQNDSLLNSALTFATK